MKVRTCGQGQDQGQGRGQGQDRACSRIWTVGVDMTTDQGWTCTIGLMPPACRKVGVARVLNRRRLRAKALARGRIPNKAGRRNNPGKTAETPVLARVEAFSIG